MTCETCGQSPCACTEKPIVSPPVFRSTYQPLPFGITKEEFGLALFEAVKTASAIGWCRRHAPEWVAHWEVELTRLLPQIHDPDQVRRLLTLSQ